jgi:hypothetical protein
MNKIEEYVSPELEVLEVACEHGYQNSIEDPVENEEIDWI